LNNNCTHLICGAFNGPKYDYAKKRSNIKIVNVEWFNKSAQDGPDPRELNLMKAPSPKKAKLDTPIASLESQYCKQIDICFLCTVDSPPSNNNNSQENGFELSDYAEEDILSETPEVKQEKTYEITTQVLIFYLFDVIVLDTQERNLFQTMDKREFRNRKRTNFCRDEFHCVQ
jgi:hypothetical protein